MPCDTRLKPRQTISQRADEVRRVVERVAQDLAAGRIKPKVSAKGGIAFDGLSESARDGVTDACIYRRVMATGTATAKMAIMRAEQLAGRGVDRKVLAGGHHSHDGGKTWHDH